ncbi:MAG: 1-phosphofructokinase [Bacillota bacterium]|nr:MAG: 1-phosphofructokinase [Bacillota bacterium]
MLAVCLNPALDVTYEIDALRRGTTHRVRRVHARAGGKGVNVARVLARLGVPVVVAGFAGGATGRLIETSLSEAGFDTRWVWVDGETRRCLAVVEQGGTEAAAAGGIATEFNEPGPEISPASWRRFTSWFEEWMRREGFAAVVLSGSLPPGLPPDAYARLIALARAAGVPAVLDTSGEALRRGIAAAPHIVKPNLRELGDLPGAGAWDDGVAADQAPGHGPDPWPVDADVAGDAGSVDEPPPLAWQVARAAEALRAAGPETVVVSMGAGGLVAATAGGTWWARAPVLRGNPVGAGDALVAALVHGGLRGWAWPDRLAHAAAVAAAAVASPVAGDFVADVYARLRDRVHVQALSSASPGGWCPSR